MDARELGRTLRGGVVGQPPPAAPGRENKSLPSGGGGCCEQSPLWLGLDARQPLRGAGIAGPQPGKRGSPSSALALACRAPLCRPPCGGGWLGHSHIEGTHLRLPSWARPVCLLGTAAWCVPVLVLWAGLNVGGEGVPGLLSPRPTGTLPSDAAQPARLQLFLVLVRGCSWPSPGCSLGPGLSSSVGLSLGPRSRMVGQGERHGHHGARPGRARQRWELLRRGGRGLPGEGLCGQRGSSPWLGWTSRGHGCLDVAGWGGHE